MTLYGRYIAEREDFSIIETDQGFATFKVVANTIYLRDLFVLPEFRRSKVASELCDQVCRVGRNLDCATLVGSLDPKALNANESLSAIMSYGMKLKGQQGSLLYFEKGL